MNIDFSCKSKNIDFSCRSQLFEAKKNIVGAVNSSALETIYTYTGNENHEPVYYEETELFKSMLKEVGITCKIVEVSDSMFDPSKWNPAASLLHIPGAISSELDEHLGEKVEAIRAYVEAGGRFIGWCGGGYWACHKVEYLVSETETLRKTRSLAFWKGTEKGPLIPFLGNPTGNIGFFHGAVPVKWTGSKILQKEFPEGITTKILLSGGGSFVPAENEYPYSIAAKYMGEEYIGKSFAAVKTLVGKGVSFLMNPYVTHGEKYLSLSLAGYKKYFPEHPWDKIVADLKDNDLERQVIFADLLYQAINPEDGISKL